jgi:hypothetical protein
VAPTVNEMQTPAEYAASHMSHELDCMLIAATHWAALHPDARRRYPTLFVWTAEYAAFLHQRGLFELFCNNKNSAVKETRRFLGHRPIVTSNVWRTWEVPLNTAGSHVYGRHVADPPHRDGDQLKNQVAALAVEVVRLWLAFANLTAEPGVKEAMTTGLRKANARAETIAREIKSPHLNWLAVDPFAGWGDRKWWPAP